MSLENTKTYQAFPDFFGNKAIKKLANISKWSISLNKMPISLIHLELYDKIKGCDYKILHTTENLCDSISIIESQLEKYGITPILNNHAFFLDSITDDNYVVIDIEPICPDDIKQKLLELPYEYAEKSLSGKGIHLLLKQPDDLPKALLEKTVIKHNKKYFEILQSHWVTFTRNIITPISNPKTEKNKDLLKELYLSLQKSNKSYQYTKEDMPILQIPDLGDIPESDYLIDKLTSPNHIFKKTLEDFYGDNSQYEFNFLIFKYKYLKNLITSDYLLKKNYVYSVEQITAILNKTALLLLPHREKHTRYIKQVPYLVYTIQRIIASDNDDLTEIQIKKQKNINEFFSKSQIQKRLRDKLKQKNKKGENL